MAIVNEFAEVISKNTLMLNAISESPILNIDQNILTLNQSELDYDLQLSITEAIAGAKLKSLDYEPKKISISISGKHFIIGICHLSEKSDADDNIFLGAMIYLIPDTNMDISASKEKLQSLFSLTEKEAQICCYLMNNTSIKTIARNENKAISTVREQIQSCYKKTGTTSQLELISLIGSIPV